MAKTGSKQNNRAYLHLKALNDVAQEFADAMCKADAAYILRGQGGTPRMHEIWARYVALMRKYA